MLMENISQPGGYVTLPVHVRARRSQLAREAASERHVDTNEVWVGRVADLLRQIPQRHRGSFDPSRISHQLMGLAPGEETAYSKLNKLLEKDELKEFVKAHCEFACQRVWGGGGGGGDDNHLGRGHSTKLCLFKCCRRWQ